MRLQIAINSTFEEEKALLNLDNKEVIFRGDYYHDKIDEYIQGFLKGLSYANIQYELLDNAFITPDMEMFDVCDFVNESYED